MGDQDEIRHDPFAWDDLSQVQIIKWGTAHDAGERRRALNKRVARPLRSPSCRNERRHSIHAAGLSTPGRGLSSECEAFGRSVGARFVDVSGSAFAYYGVLRDLWAAGETFIYVEHDVVPDPGAIARDVGLSRALLHAGAFDRDPRQVRTRLADEVAAADRGDGSHCLLSSHTEAYSLGFGHPRSIERALPPRVTAASPPPRNFAPRRRHANLARRVPGQTSRKFG